MCVCVHVCVCVCVCYIYVGRKIEKQIIKSEEFIVK